jgi:hypothetical protein
MATLPTSYTAFSDPMRTGQSTESTEFLSNELRVLDRYELQADLVETLQEIDGREKLVTNVEACHKSFRHRFCSTHESHWASAENSCGCRLCPHCQRHRSNVLAHRWAEFLIGRHNLRYIVFAERNSADLIEGIRSLFAAWDRLRRSAFWQKYVDGAIVVFEVTRNREEGTWHPHLNLLVEGDYVPFEDLNAAWVGATRGNGRTSHISKADAGTVRELIKYVTKTSDLVGDPPAVEEFLIATARRRLVRTYGTFFRIPIEDEDPADLVCPDAPIGSHCCQIRRLEAVWPWQLSLDDAEVFRISGAMFDRGG